jgi:hypothetical protein
MKMLFRKLKPLALANEEEPSLVLTNDVALDDEGWGLIAPFGEWPKTRTYREGGQIKEQKFIQVLDNAAADAMVGKENTFFRSLKRALVGIPVYRGHGDLKDVDPQALGNTDQKVKIGVVDKIRKSARGVEAHFALDNDGAKAVEEGCKFPSALWYVLPNGKRGDATLCTPCKLISVALTEFPNISGVESLANARSKPVDAEQTQPKTPDMKLIAGWLMAQGIALANSESPTETQILEGFQRLHNQRTEAVTALGNEKTTLNGRVTTLEAERNTEKKRADDTALALANEQAARKAERKRSATAGVDLLIHRGIKTVAERDVTLTALENSTDFDKDLKALLDAKATTRTTTNATTESGKVLANEEADAHAEYDREFKKALANNGQDPIKAHSAVMKLPGLADKLRPKQH